MSTSKDNSKSKKPNKLISAFKKVLKESELKLHLLTDYTEIGHIVENLSSSMENKYLLLKALAILAQQKNANDALNFYIDERKKIKPQTLEEIKQKAKLEKPPLPLPKVKKFRELSDEVYDKLDKEEKSRYAYNKFMSDDHKKFRTRARDYLKKLNNGTITNPRKSTLDQYWIKKKSDGVYYVNWFEPRQKRKIFRIPDYLR